MSNRKRPQTYNQIKQWLKRHNKKIKITKRAGYIRIYMLIDNRWVEKYARKANNITDVYSIVRFFIEQNIKIDWKTECKEPKSIVDVYEWLDRQYELENYIISMEVVERGMGMWGQGPAMGLVLYNKIKTDTGEYRFNPLRTTLINNYIEGAVFDITEELKLLGIKKDW